MYIFIFLFKACSEELNFERLQTYIIFLSKYSTTEFAKDVSMVSTVSGILSLDKSHNTFIIFPFNSQHIYFYPFLSVSFCSEEQNIFTISR